MFFKQYYLGCLSQASYMVGDDREVVVVDPQRDIEQYLKDANAMGLTIRAVIETHLHADFVSGHVELAQRTGAPIYVGSRTDVAFAHVPVEDGMELRLGRVVLCFLETPGHTPESIVVLVRDEAAPAQPAKLLTGDTLFIGDVGRPDLVAAGGYPPETMAEMMYDSLHKILRLPDEVEVYPAHGAGSSCGRFISDERVSTIGRERSTNWALQISDRVQFVAQMTADLPPPPPYFQVDAELNRQGAAALGELPAPSCLPPDAFAASMAAGRQVLDVRDTAAFGRGHVPGALHIGLSGQFAPWAGTLLKIGEPILLVAEDLERVREATIRLARVGHETVEGCLAAGMEAWLAAGRPTVTLPQLEVASLFRRLAAGDPLTVLDVRRASERAAGHVRGSQHIPLDVLPGRLAEIDRSRALAVICGSGYRSSIACSLLQHASFEHVVNVSGGHAAWEKAGLALEK